MHYWGSTLPAERETIAQTVEEYNDHARRIRIVHACLEEHLEHVSIADKWGRSGQVTKFDLDHALENLKTGAWRAVIKKMQVEEICSKQRLDGINSQIEGGDCPDFTVDNILALAQSFSQQLPEYFKEACKEVLDWIKPGSWERDYKTNDRNAKYEVGKKIIKSCMVEYYCDRISYRQEQILRSLDNVFHMLDGAGTVRYPGDLVTAINQAMKDSDECSTEYFHVRWFKNRNMHITFLRDDLLAEFNAVIHGKALDNPQREKPAKRQAAKPASKPAAPAAEPLTAEQLEIFGLEKIA